VLGWSDGSDVSPETYLEMLGDWPAAVGRFVLAFSSCEYWTYVYLQQLGSRAIRAELANSKLSVRVGRILQLSRIGKLPEDVHEEISSLCNKLRSLAKKRNLAAHNAPMAHVFENPRTGQLDLRFEMRGANNPELQVTPESLRAWFSEAVALDEKLALLAGQISRARAG
jgi:hypothetical protein